MTRIPIINERITELKTRTEGVREKIVNGSMPIPAVELTEYAYTCIEYGRTLGLIEAQTDLTAQQEADLRANLKVVADDMGFNRPVKEDIEPTRR